jgi:hypothetical protein
LLHGLNRSGGIPEPDGPTSADGSAGGGSGGMARVGKVDEGGGDGSVQGASGPWGRPLGPMVVHVIRRTASAPTGR